jgi:hypothetical protein
MTAEWLVEGTLHARCLECSGADAANGTSLNRVRSAVIDRRYSLTVYFRL